MRYLVLSFALSIVTGIGASTPTVATATTTWSFPALLACLAFIGTVATAVVGLSSVQTQGIGRF